jgi:hypothetical protein
MVALTIYDLKGGHEAKSLADFQAVLEKRYGPDANSFWIWHYEEKNPAISLLVRGNLSCIHYFPYEGHPGFVSVGTVESLDKDGFTSFRFETVEQEQEIWNPHVISASAGISAARDFFSSKDLPKSIEWKEL